MSHSQAGKGTDLCTLTQHAKTEVRVTEGAASIPRVPRGLSMIGFSLLEGWDSTEFLLQQGVGPLALELEW